MADLLKLYHRLPYPLRILAVSARGYYLRRWRYTADTDRLVAEALEREQWSTQRWQIWQAERLAYVLHRAATRVPYYREQWQRRRRTGDRAAWDLLPNWPILAKDEVRATPQAFVADDCNLRQMYEEHTSGTSGKPLTLWWSRATVVRWYALFEARIRCWHGVSRQDRWAILGGQLVAPFAQSSPPFWVWNAGLNQLYMSSYHLASRFIPAYIDALRRHSIVYALGYPSALYALAQGILQEKLEAPALKVAINNAEPLYDYQRQAIAQAFGCPVVDTYGMAEIVCAASECAHGSLHLWPEIGTLEVLNEQFDAPVPVGEVGRLVCTSLFNADMPLIRYAVGDRGALSLTAETCCCGRPLPILASVEGRSDDVILTPDGRRIGRLDPVFKADLPVREAQIVQTGLQSIEVRIVPAAHYTDAAGQSIVERLQDRVGDMQVTLVQVDEIPRTSNGKFRAVISLLDSK